MSLLSERELKISYCEFDKKADGMYRLKRANSYDVCNLSDVTSNDGF